MGNMKKLLLIGAAAVLLLGLFACTSDNAPQNKDQPEPTKELTAYEQLLTTLQEKISENLASNSPDMHALQEDYELLLSLRINEAYYKGLAYSYFTGDSETTQFDYITEICGDISSEMKKYFPEDQVDTYYMASLKLAINSVDRINLDDFLIGSREAPDVDAMWNEFIEASLGIANDEAILPIESEDAVSMSDSFEDACVDYAGYDLSIYQNAYYSSASAHELSLLVLPDGASFAATLRRDSSSSNLEMGVVYPGVATQLEGGTWITVDLNEDGTINVIIGDEFFGTMEIKEYLHPVG